MNKEIPEFLRLAAKPDMKGLRHAITNWSQNTGVDMIGELTKEVEANKIEKKKERWATIFVVLFLILAIVTNCIPKPYAFWTVSLAAIFLIVSIRQGVFSMKDDFKRGVGEKSYWNFRKAIEPIENYMSPIESYRENWTSISHVGALANKLLILEASRLEKMEEERGNFSVVTVDMRNRFNLLHNQMGQIGWADPKKDRYFSRKS